MFGDIGKMLRLAGEMKTKLPAMQAKMAATTFTAQAGGGVARATVNGKGSVTEIWIDPAALRDSQMTAETLGEIVKAAINAAQEQAAEAMQEAMKELTGGMDIPGLGGLTGL